MKATLTFLPALLTFGPLFMVLHPQTQSPGPYMMALAGAVGLGLGLALLFRHFVRQQQRIADLETELTKLRAESA